MCEREVRQLTPQDLPAYLNIYLNAYPAGKDLSKECYDKFYSRNLQSMEEYEGVHFFGLFEGGALIATMKLIDFNVNLFGQMRKATGLMSLAVHPLHKKKGAAREMVRFFERYTVESGGAASILLPFRIDFYKKLGYGCGTRLEEYHIKMEGLPEGGDISRLRLLGKEDMDRILACHEAFVRRNHGALFKFEEEIRDMVQDDEVRYLGYFEEDRIKGYASFAFVNTSQCNYTLNRIDVKELIYEDQQVLRALLSGLKMQSDLAQSVKLRSGEPDFYHLLQNPQDLSGNYINYGFLQTNVSAVGTMYKIPHIPAFVSATSHREFPSENLTAGFCVTDEQTGEEQRFALCFSTMGSGASSKADGARWSCDPSEEGFAAAEVHVTCMLSDFSSLLMGSAEFAGLDRLGVIKTDEPAYVRRLDRLFHAEQKPFTNTDY